MKKVVSGALAAAIITTNMPLRVLAEEVNKTDNIPDLGTAIDKTTNKKGYIEVDINLDMPIQNAIDTRMSVSLRNKNNEEIKAQLGMEIEEPYFNFKNMDCSYTVEALGLGRNIEAELDGKVYAYRVTFKDLPAGEDELYYLKIEGDGFSKIISEDIELNEYSKRIAVNNTFNENSNLNSEEGLAPIGDVNKDNVVNDEDYNAIFEKIGNDNEKEYDLNRDKKIDILDLQYVHENMGKKAKSPIPKNTEWIPSSENVEISNVEGQEITGLENIFTESTDDVLSIETKDTEISDENPAKLNLDFKNSENSSVTMQYISILGGNSAPQEGYVEITTAQNEKKTIYFGKDFGKNIARTSFRNAKKSDNIIIDLKGQIAVSEITINITKTTNDRNLAEIAKVEFINDVYKEIPKPEMNIPKIKSVKTSTATGDESMTISWSSEQNITGYELKVEEIDENGRTKGKTRLFRMSDNNFKVIDVKPYSRYRLSVQSVNGDWEGGYKIADSNDENGVIDNIVAESIENGTYEPKDFDADGIVNIMVIPDSIPEPPEGVKVEGKYKSLDISWKKHSSAQSFDVYYRKMETGQRTTTPGLEGFTKANEKPITNTTSYSILNLEDNSSYEVKLTATNHKGTSGPSKGAIATTMDIRIPESPNYRLINKPNGHNKLTQHITSVEYPKKNEVIVDDEDCIVDNDYTTAWSLEDWDSGATYSNNKRGPIVNFDKEYKINKIGLITRLDAFGVNPNKALISVWDKENKKWVNQEPSVHNYNKNGRYTILKLKEPITSDKIQICLSAGPRKLSISELKFYEYDEVEGQVNNLFKDDLKIELRDGVTQEEITNLKTKIETPEEETGEFNIDKKSLLEKVELAQKLYDDKNASKKIITVDPLINPSGVNTGYGNDWQALGFTAKAGSEITVYMSTNEPSKRVEFAYEQHYGESGSFISKPITLKPGENKITLEKLTDTNVEKGGNLYVRFPHALNNSNAKIKIRVSGAEEIPHLNLNNYLEDVDYLINNKNNESDEKVSAVKAKLREYILSLDKHIKEMPEKYEKNTTDAQHIQNIYSYDERTSILNSTNIEGDRFTLTLPATEVYRGINDGANGNIDKQVDNLYDTVLAWEQLIQITNAKKGVIEKKSNADYNNDGVIDEKDTNTFNSKFKSSRQRVNVKYQRMFIGAFMYASGHHVGVDAGSSEGLMKGVPFKFDENGRVTNPDEGKLFGWGISHEIGHKADIGKRTYSETSNNILALITQSFDGVDKSRLEENKVYPNIYKKVTSGSIGLSQDISTLLGMFWQLHLAYEPGYTSQMLKNNNDSDLNNDSYYAKMNRLYRNLIKEEENIDRDQLLIIKASEAAGKDLREFFRSWGLISDNRTNIYLQERFPDESQKERRKIQYLNDEAYRKRLQGIEDMAQDTKVEASFKNGVTSGSIINGSKVTLNLNVNKDKDKILGYEIIRNDGNIHDGESTKVKYRPVGFVNANVDGSAEFTDDISPINNRAMTYKVVAYDYNLNPTEEFTVGSVKLSHDGTIDSSNFILKSNLISTENDGEFVDNIDLSKVSAINENTVESKKLDNIKDGDKNTAFKGRRMTSSEYNKNPHKQEGIYVNEDPYIVMDLQGSKNISGFKYTKSSDSVSRFSLKRLFNRNSSYSPISKYEILISDDAKDWTKVSEGSFEFGNETVLGGSSDKDTAKVLFNKNGNLYSYDAKYVKFVAKDAGDSNLDIADISLIGSTGDNIEIGAVDKANNTRTNGIGRLESDFVYNESQNSKIPAGSIVITGEYKGNPAFNVPLVIDENNKTIGGKVILMANVPENAPLGSVADGKWIYWIDKEDFSNLSSKVKAELYRYNELDADKNPIGQRLTSDTLYVDVNANTYEDLPVITLENSGKLDEQENLEKDSIFRRKIKKSNSDWVYVDINNFERKDN